jgi:hypothetical protein
MHCHGGAVGWGTALQTARSWVLLLKYLLFFLKHPIIYIYICICVLLWAFVGFAIISYFSINSYGSFEVVDFQFEGVVSFPYLESGLDNGNKIWIDIRS